MDVLGLPSLKSSQMESSPLLNPSSAPYKGKLCKCLICIRTASTKHQCSLTVVKPDISKSTIVGTSCAILILLFLIQPLGTSKIGSLFAPIVIIWLTFNLAFGIYVSLASQIIRVTELTQFRILYTSIIPS